MKETLTSLNKELDGVDLVLDKLITKANTSVFEKLCTNCDKIFNTFCTLPIDEIVKTGNAKYAIEILARLKEQVIKLKNYKAALLEFMEMETGTEAIMPSPEEVQEQANNITNTNNKERTLSLENPDSKAA